MTRTIEVGGREAALYFIDGFCKDDLLQKLLQYFMDMKPEDMPQDASQLLKKGLPYIEVDQEKEWEKITSSVLSGIFVLLVEGYREAVLIDAVLIHPEAWRSRKRIRCCGAPRTALWRRWCLTRR